MLEQLLYKKRSLIDGWDKMMSIYSAADWPYFHFIREQKGIETISILQHRKQSEALLYTDTVIENIKENGPLLPKQIPLGAATVSSWGHRKIKEEVWLLCNSGTL